MKILTGILTVIMVVFAILQWNDPDGLIWIIVYGYVALMSGQSLFGKLSSRLILAGMAGLFLGLLFYVPDMIRWIGSGMPSITGNMKADTPFIELIREFLGLLIAFLVMVYLFYKERSGRRKAKG